MTGRVRWLGGSAPAREAAVAWLERAEGEPLHESPHRRVVRLGGHAGGILLKHFRTGSGRHPWRERARSWLGRGPADREWRALRALFRTGAPVPEPLALGVLANGDRLLLMEHVTGAALPAALGTGAADRRALTAALGGAVAALHSRGFVHVDLHVGNVLVGARGPLLLDLQRARRSRSQAARIRDLGHLDHSLAALLSTSDRVRVRAAALGLVRPFDPAARAAIRSVGDASAQRARRHAASRRRHALREGRAAAPVAVAGGHGLRLRSLSEAAVASAIAAHEAAAASRGPEVIDRDPHGAVCAIEIEGHRMVSKEARPRGVCRAVADCFRGSPGRRAFAAGHGLQVLSVGAATPLAFVEWRRLGLPSRSVVLLEDLRPDEGAHRLLEAATPAVRNAALDALLGLVLRLHRSGIDHGDLKASNVLLRATRAGFEARLVDLEGVRFLGRVPDATRVRALAQLNASVGDSLDAASRRRFFGRYAQALRFAAGSRTARDAVVRESLARRHRWSGRGCEAASREPPPSSARGGSRSTGT